MTKENFNSEAGSTITPSTYFAPPDRLTLADVKEQASRIHEPIVETMLTSIDGYVMVLNDHRQILAANEELLIALGLKNEDDVLSLKPGEAWGCQNAKIGPSGCGTSKSCRYCGQLLATMATMKTHEVARNECHLTMERNGVYETRDMKVHTAPLKIAGLDLVVVVFIDVTGVVRKDFLERAFFHDLNNLLTGLSGWSDLLGEESHSDAASAISKLTDLLCEEVSYHRLIASAENGDLVLSVRSVSVTEIIKSVRNITDRLPNASSLDLSIEVVPIDAKIMTDKRLVVRILTNMLKNAYEVSEKGDHINLKCLVEDEAIIFSINNPAVLSPDISEQVFKRTFTTKEGIGRGMGTYIAKMFGEHYLHGEVYFDSAESTGTTFYFKIPNLID